jgi:hypothetical protein
MVEAQMQRVLYLASISIRGVQRCRNRCGAANDAVDAGYKQSKQLYLYSIYTHASRFMKVLANLSYSTAFQVVSNYYWRARAEWR